jgi:hypothetical protein
MKVKDLLDSENDPDAEDLIQLIKKHCPKNFKSVIEGKVLPLFRGDRSPNVMYANNELMFFKSRPREEPRPSLTHSSFINSYISASVDWGMVPDRSLSNSCTTDYNTASDFGKRPYLIIPFDNVKTFASIEYDWNDKEINNKFQLADFGGMVEELQIALRDIADHTNEEIFGDLPNEIQDAFNSPAINAKLSKPISKSTVDELLEILYIMRNYLFRERYPDRALQSEITVFLNTYKRLFGTENPTKFMQAEMTPQKMHVELYNGYKNLEPHETDSPEIWFEGQFIALSTGLSDTEDLAQSEMLRNLAKYI